MEFLNQLTFFTPVSVPENSRENFSSSYWAISLLPVKIILKQLKCFKQKIQPFPCLEQGLRQGQTKASFPSLWKRQFAQILRRRTALESDDLFFQTLCLHRATWSPRKRKAPVGRMCPSQLSGTRIRKTPLFFAVQLLLQPPDATAALEWEPGAAAAAPHRPVLENGHCTAFN